MTLLDELLMGWCYTREGVIAELENLPPDRLEERPLGVKRSALDLAHHIVESGWLMAGELSRSDGDFQRKSYDELVAEHTPDPGARDRHEALEQLQRAHEAGDAMLRSAGPDLLQRPIRQFNGVPASRLSWMHHGIAHEEYHRGQLAVYARLLGVTPALTRQILGE
ncbi:MAG TPA: DinB family protein [Longimicrobiales bacterium]|nr:DinB family protein [Longimicrobiales bacterium]